MTHRQTFTTFLRKPVVFLVLSLTLAGLASLALGSGSDASADTEVLRSLGAIAGLAAGQLPRIGQLVGQLLARGGSRAPTIVRPSTTAIQRFVPGGAGLGSLARRGAVVGGAGAAFEIGSRALPGGSPFPGDFSLPGFGGGSRSPASGIAPGAQFGDTFITQMWQSGVTADGVPILHGILANGKRFATNRNGGIKVFRPRKNIVIGSNPRLSDAGKVARIAARMERSAEAILKINGKKAVKR